MIQLNISLPDEIERQIAATGRTADELILEILEDHFRKEGLSKDRAQEALVPTAEKQQKEISIEVTRTRHAMRVEAEEMESDMAEAEGMGQFSTPQGKKLLDEIKRSETKIQNIEETNKEAERAVERIEETISVTKKTASEFENTTKELEKTAAKKVSN